MRPSVLLGYDINSLTWLENPTQFHLIRSDGDSSHCSPPFSVASLESMSNFLEQSKCFLPSSCVLWVLIGLWFVASFLHMPDSPHYPHIRSSRFSFSTLCSVYLSVIVFCYKKNPAARLLHNHSHCCWCSCIGCVYKVTDNTWFGHPFIWLDTLYLMHTQDLLQWGAQSREGELNAFLLFRLPFYSPTCSIHRKMSSLNHSSLSYCLLGRGHRKTQKRNRRAFETTSDWKMKTMGSQPGFQEVQFPAAHEDGKEFRGGQPREVKHEQSSKANSKGPGQWGL